MNNYKFIHDFPNILKQRLEDFPEFAIPFLIKLRLYYKLNQLK